MTPFLLIFSTQCLFSSEAALALLLCLLCLWRKKYEALLVSVAYTCLSPLTDKASFISARRFPQKMHFFSSLKKSPVKQQRTLFAFSYSHSVFLHTVSREILEPWIITPCPTRRFSRYCYSVESEAQSPPSSRSLSMVINRYGPCLPACVCYRQRLPWVRGGRSDGGRRPGAPEV